jgi:hypothetical protein
LSFIQYTMRYDILFLLDRSDRLNHSLDRDYPATSCEKNSLFW